ncbi:Rubredoxin-type Fe(Cys)4 protein [Thermodesulfobium narugense DSM 14796]|uniref:Rubredoxin n=1 Tax=Thermodesulfobium narugense DSM 14796 TaxID=747365 RepID=M1E993_9BACT|nr:rubredoxin [Thermodesulfobium narugense]AEE14964.1 Rubredoxin-type Fe(Cys)4 protein [Thermodesulfobium narugense DSM 14796]
MKIFHCMCGYEYNPNFGDLENGIPPGTPFEDLTQDWKCPWCDAAKDTFKEGKNEEDYQGKI